jgi:threonylcarbamoyladenosine tRNA methylthiotransferase MtaB
MHIFSYSKRPNTEAFSILPIIDKNDVMYRRKMLQSLSNEKFNQHVKKNINHIQNVLFEKSEGGFAQGLTENYIRVYVKSDKPLQNKIKKVKLITHDENVIGQFCE